MQPPAPTPRRGRFRLPVVLLYPLAALSLGMACPAFAVRVVTYNVLNYPGSTGDTREVHYRTVLSAIAPDVIIAQEIQDPSAATEFLTDVLNVIEPGAWALAPFTDGNDTNNACYYRTTVLDYLSNVRLFTSPREIDGFEFLLDGYVGSGATFRVYSLHLKASQGGDNENQRLAAVQTLRNHLEALPVGTPFVVGGDFNIYTSSEPAWVELTGSQPNDQGRMFDPIDSAGAWHNNATYASIHTQSTRTTSLPDGGATGGMDDRFDMQLVNDDLQDGEGIDTVPGSYAAFGQDGLHFNAAITDAPPNAVVSAAIASALHDASDHLPVVMELQVPAFLSVEANLAFGPVLVGTVAQRAILVQNTAVPPADDLQYSLSAGPGFTVVGGTVSVSPGGSDTPSVTVDTSVPAEHGTFVTLDSNWPNDPSVPLAATATVLAASVPSLDPGVVVVSDLVDFGEQEIGQFVPQNVDVHNLGYGSLQALLEVYDARIEGNDAARFSVPAFAASLVGSTPATYAVEFDDTGAAEGTTYSATLTFSCRDDPTVTGSQTRPDLVVGLEATVKDTGTPVSPRPSWVTRLHPNLPNPFNPSTAIRFELAAPERVDLTIYNAQGRVVRTLVDRHYEEGRHQVRWDGRSDAGEELASGVYFYRMRAGTVIETRRMTLIR